jgi:GNAT superfamily N-acetyltransferase
LSGVRFPQGFRLEPLRREHRRRGFCSGVQPVDDWLRAKALQNQRKHLSTTKVLLDPDNKIAGYYTLAIGLVDFGDLPAEVIRTLPRRALPVVVLAWLGVHTEHQGTGLGRLLLAQALRDCHEAGKTFAFVAVLLDCTDDSAKAFYQRWDFAALPGSPYRLYLSTRLLTAMVEEPP